MGSLKKREEHTESITPYMDGDALSSWVNSFTGSQSCNYYGFKGLYSKNKPRNMFTKYISYCLIKK